MSLDVPVDEPGNSSADAGSNDARELVGGHDDDDTVESDRVEHPLRVIER
jgi:hypothetical protein